jgi:hypothetical protein
VVDRSPVAEREGHDDDDRDGCERRRRRRRAAIFSRFDEDHNVSALVSVIKQSQL